MKALRIIGSPIAIISMFLFILISGEAFGGPYLIYLILGLPHGANYCLTGIFGIGLLLVCRKINNIGIQKWVYVLLSFMGILLLLSSLLFFFSRERLRYNYDTFLSSLPIFTIILFGITIVSWIVINLIEILKAKKHPDRNLT
ncbi:MAG: hypothetical protein ACXVLT_03940 [Flavisolibacter sp.]